MLFKHLNLYLLSLKLKVKIQLMLKTVRSILFLLILFPFLYGRVNISLWTYGGSIYILDGFEKTIRIFDTDMREIKQVSVKNISTSGSFDFFSVHDPYRSYLNDTVSGIIWQLDGKYEVKMTLDVKKSGHELSHATFPHEYNSLIAASENRESVFLIRNSIFSEIITSDISFTDIWASDGLIYLLYSEKVLLYTAEGVFVSEIPLKKMYSKIRISGAGMFLYSEGSVTHFDPAARENVELRTGKVLDFCVTGGRLFYIAEDTGELKSEDL